MNERLEREIEEILRQAEVPPSSRKARGGGGGPSQDFGASFGIWDFFLPRRLFYLSGALFLSWLLLKVTGVGFAGIFFWLFLVLFIFAYALYFVRSEKGPERRWRGRVVDNGAGTSWRDRMRH